MEENNIYSIVDLDGYANSLRDGVAKSFVDNYTENLDDYITLEQVKNIIIGYSLGQDDNGDYLINSEVFNDTFDDVREWFYEAGLSKLAAKGVIECAWDNETNQMIFWSNNDTKRTNTIETRDR
jgi:hypothetical protein